MHIAYLTPEYPHAKIKNGGGMGTSIKNLVEALSALDHEITLFVYGQTVDSVFQEGNITYHLIKQRTYKLGGFYFYRKFLQKYINTYSEGIDMLEAPDWTGITAFMKLKLPLVIRFHGSDTYFCHLENRSQKWKNKFFEKNAVKKATAFVAPTTYAGEVSMKLFGLPNDKLSIIPYGLELEKFENDALESYEPFTLLNIGTLIRKKGVFQLVEIFNQVIKEFPQARLIFIGGDSQDVISGRNSTWEIMKEKMSEAAMPQVSYLGKIPYNEVQENIKNAHVCVFPSLAETLGMVTIESMALGKAVVNTNIGWAQDLIIHEKDGYMYHPDDIDNYVDTIIKLFKDQDLLYSIGKNAINSVNNKFDIIQLVDQNIVFYKSVLK